MKRKVFFEEDELSTAGRARMTERWNLRHRCEAGNMFVSTFMWFPLANHSCSYSAERCSTVPVAFILLQQDALFTFKHVRVLLISLDLFCLGLNKTEQNQW